MRWESLFSDLEAQLVEHDAAELRAEVAERSRSEQASVRLADRLRAARSTPLVLSLRDGSCIRGGCADSGPDWVVLDEGRTRWLVPLDAVSAVGGLTRFAAPPAGAVLRRLGLASALRAIARARAGVRLQCDGAELTGTIDRVGADHLDLAEHALGEPRRREAVRQVLAVPFRALIAIGTATVP